jgi:hypothetical protein
LQQKPGVVQTRVSVVSLNDERTISSIFREIGHTTVMHQDVRRQVFRQVAKSAKLQRMFLDVLAKDPKAQKAVLRELVKVDQLKRKFVVIAHEQFKSKGTAVSRKQGRNP